MSEFDSALIESANVQQSPQMINYTSLHRQQICDFRGVKEQKLENYEIIAWQLKKRRQQESEHSHRSKVNQLWHSHLYNLQSRGEMETGENKTMNIPQKNIIYT